MNAYEKFVRPFLFSLDPETAHHLALRSLRLASHFPFALRALHCFQPPPKPTTVFGITFPNPIGLAAGFDKNGVALPAWAALGFGFFEIGTVTAKAQPGNPRPRIFRYPEQQALINRLGFNNDGAEVVAARLRRLRASGRWPAIPVGINIGKSKITPLADAADDYVYSFRTLREFADYIVLNISSPNTPGLRSLQEHEALEKLLRAIQRENSSVQAAVSAATSFPSRATRPPLRGTPLRPRLPIVVKIAPDLAFSDLEQIIATCEANGIAGLIATNTTLDHTCIPSSLDQAGGLSGAPLRQKSTDFIRAITARSRLPVIASGGISDALSAREKFEAGAQLLQIYTGYIYRGPGLLREVAATTESCGKSTPFRS